ncbi:MAG TPA: beta-galactosidase, partial [Pyrinomonadaceae bacterium]|nr:beta-galactosidase [Pyrinomonadaceae bacterium]
MFTRRTKFNAVVILVSILLTTFRTAGAQSQPPRMSTILYGVSYYHEYMPYERLDKDVQMMKDAGINLVRMGESSWGLWEPEDGRFDFAWMDRIVDRMHRAGIKILMGTPTYSIPAWLYRKHPEVLARRLGGERPTYGMRQNMDVTNPTFLFYAERVIRQILNHYKNHPAVIGWQVDNETTAYGTAGPNVQVAFTEHLKKKFGAAGELNKAWGLNYWGQRINDWDELPPRDGILNPGYKLEWERYQHKIATDYLAWQARIVNEYKRADQFVTHNFVGGVRTDINQYDIAQNLDIAGTNPYAPWAVGPDAIDGSDWAISGDLTRSLKRQNYLITETNAQTIGWDSKTQFPPYDGQLRLNVYSHLASGANMVAYWHWHSLHYGQETYWKGVLSHDLEPNRAYAEVSRTAHELKELGPRLVNLKKTNRVALLYSVDSYHGIQHMPFDNRVNYQTVLHQMYGALYRQNVGVDFVFPQSTNFNDYKVIVVPPLYVAPDALLQKLSDFVRQGGHLVMSFKSGFTNENSTVRWTKAPGPLREAAGFYYQEFANLQQPLKLKGDPFQTGEENTVRAWAEFLIPEKAVALAYYDHPFYGKWPALTRNTFGKGTLTYEGTFLSDKLQERVLLDVIKLAGLDGPDQQLPAPVRVRHGVNNAGKNLHYYLNYSSQGQTFTYPYAGGTDLLMKKPVSKSQAVELGPW